MLHILVVVSNLGDLPESLPCGSPATGSIQIQAVPIERGHAVPIAEPLLRYGSGLRGHLLPSRSCCSTHVQAAAPTSFAFSAGAGPLPLRRVIRWSASNQNGAPNSVATAVFLVGSKSSAARSPFVRQPAWRTAALSARLSRSAGTAYRRRITTFPKWVPLSWYRYAAEASAKGNTRSTTGLSWWRAIARFIASNMSRLPT